MYQRKWYSPSYVINVILTQVVNTGYTHSRGKDHMLEIAELADKNIWLKRWEKLLSKLL